jgi:DNA-binding FrmR family transcriptional regulator
MQQKYYTKLINHLHRIQGQLKGVEKMLQDNKYCVDIITQSLAVQKSLSRFDEELLKNHLEEHVVHQFSHGQKEKAISEVLKVFNLHRK